MSSNKILSAHQPNFIPWVGYFHKILKSDIFVFLDHVEYTRRSFINRNRIKGPMGAIWITVPVTIKGKQRIKDVKICNTIDWKRKHLSTFRAFYGKAKYFDEFYPVLEKIYSKEWIYLADFNKEIIKTITRMLDIDTKFIDSSYLNPAGKKMDMIIDLCKKVGATVYFSGIGAKKYQDESIFEKNGIKLIYQKFEHPVYPQRFGKFIPNLSIVDMIFNVGIPKTKEILHSL